ncbi:MAG: iron ABC transporter permease [Spirochaetales bacterium]|nr:iron ABC transporter permease [Spirochaetales bacterium]
MDRGVGTGSKQITIRSEGKRTVLFNTLLLAGPILFIILFFYYPLGSILFGGLTDSRGKVDFGTLLMLLKDPYYLRIIGFTVAQAFLSTLLSVILGIPGAYMLSRYDFRGKGFIKALTTLPFVLPSIIVVLGFVRFFGNNGVLNRFLMELFGLAEPPLKILYSFQAILLAHAFYNFPVVVRIVSSYWERIHPGTEEAARSLGAHGFGLFRRVTLPQILPALLSSAALVFIFCFLSFAVILVLGGGPRYSTLEVEVYRLAKVSLDLKTGSALALIGTFLSLIFLYGYIRIQHKASFPEEMSSFEKPRLTSFLRSPRGLLFLLYFVCMAVVILAPMITVVLYSFQERTGWGQHAISLKWYKEILSPQGPYLRAVLNSLFIALMTTLLALPIGTLLAYGGSKSRFAGSRLLEAVVMLPIGVSSIILGLGYLKAYQHFPWEITGTFYALVFAHTVIAYPFVIRVLSAAFRKMKPSLAEAGRSLGAGSWQLFWNLELPLVRSSLITGAAFAFGISVGEINATLMLYNEDLVTIPVMIYRLIGSYNFIGACAMGAVLMLFCFLAFLSIDKAGGELG